MIHSRAKGGVTTTIMANHGEPADNPDVALGRCYPGLSALGGQPAWYRMYPQALMTGQSLLDQGRQHNDCLPRVEQRDAKSHES